MAPTDTFRKTPEGLFRLYFCVKQGLYGFYNHYTWRMASQEELEEAERCGKVDIIGEED